MLPLNCLSDSWPVNVNWVFCRKKTNSFCDYFCWCIFLNLTKYLKDVRLPEKIPNWPTLILCIRTIVYIYNLRTEKSSFLSEDMQRIENQTKHSLQRIENQPNIHCKELKTKPNIHCKGGIKNKNIKILWLLINELFRFKWWKKRKKLWHCFFKSNSVILQYMQKEKFHS